MDQGDHARLALVLEALEHLRARRAHPARLRDLQQEQAHEQEPEQQPGRTAKTLEPAA